MFPKHSSAMSGSASKITSSRPAAASWPQGICVYMCVYVRVWEYVYACICSSSEWGVGAADVCCGKTRKTEFLLSPTIVQPMSGWQSHWCSRNHTRVTGYLCTPAHTGQPLHVLWMSEASERKKKPCDPLIMKNVASESCWRVSKSRFSLLFAAGVKYIQAES